MRRKFIFKWDPIFLVAICFLPAVMLYAKDLVPWPVTTFLLIFSTSVISLWFWEINSAIDDLSEERKIQKLLYGFILIDFLASVLVVLLFQREIREEFLDRETFWFWRKLLLGMRLLFSVMIAGLMTMRLKKVLYERSSWFMFAELLVIPVLGILNLTPLIKEELKEKNLL